MIGGGRLAVGGMVVAVGGACLGGGAVERSAAVDEGVSGALEALAQVKVAVFWEVEVGRPEGRSHLCHCSAAVPRVRGQSRGAVGSRGLRGRGLFCAGQAVDWATRC